MLEFYSVNPLDGETYEDFVERQREIKERYDEHLRYVKQIRREGMNKFFFGLMMITLLAVILVGGCLDSTSYVPLIVEFFLCVPLAIGVVGYNLTKGDEE